MKKLILPLVALFIAIGVSAKSYEEGGDGAPWPFTWGQECPFPWNQVEGEWRVDGSLRAPYSGHRLLFTVDQDVTGGQLLYVDHYDAKGDQVGEGTAFADKANRITRASMTSLDKTERQKYRLLVRSYSTLKSNRCLKSSRVLAVTFCPVRGKKCLETANYTLKR